MFIIKLYLEDGEKVSFDCETEEEMLETAKNMKKNGEVFSLGKVEDDNSITEIEY